MSRPEIDQRLTPLRAPDGGFAMVALDQRESLREMFPPRADGELVGDDVLHKFKDDAIAILSPHASGVLLDHPLGAPGPGRPQRLAASCGLLLAVDQLHSVRGAGVVSSELDTAVDAEFIARVGADALKYLVIWRRGDDSFRPALDAFLALAEATGLPTFVEGIVRPAGDGGQWSSSTDRFDAIQEAARDLARGASVYKAEVPGYVPGDLAQVEAQARELTAALDVPWVVLSNGVAMADFAEAVRASCAGGASGFLAGRAIWSDTVIEPDPAVALADRSVARLDALKEIVATSRRATELEEGTIR